MRLSYICREKRWWDFRFLLLAVHPRNTLITTTSSATLTGGAGAAPCFKTESSPFSLTTLSATAGPTSPSPPDTSPKSLTPSSLFTLWGLHPRGVAASWRAGGAGPPDAGSSSPTSPSSAKGQHGGACSRIDRALAMVERPAVVGFAAAVMTSTMAIELGFGVGRLCLDLYLYVIGPRLRRALRFALGTSFLGGTLFLLKMCEWYFPEVGSGLDTSCVESLPLCGTAAELVETAAELQRHYHGLLRAHAVACVKRTVLVDAATTSTTQRLRSDPNAATRTPQRGCSAALHLTREEENELLGSILVLIRSLETQIVGTAEERALVTPRADVVETSAPRRSPPVAVQREGPPVLPTDLVMRPRSPATTPSAISPSAAVLSESAPLISPAEYVLRVIMSISIAQGWSDITEHTRTLFQDLVRNKAVPVQARIVQAVGELCSLSYELEKSHVDAITLDQRKRIAVAIDSFRPEKSVEERCTIAYEIKILPLPDYHHTTRCLGMIRKSPGRKPQLILCFVGTNTWRNWITNFNYWPVPLPSRYGVVGTPQQPSAPSAGVWPSLFGSQEFAAQPYVHRGFLGLVQTIAFKEVAADFDQIIVVGHSLGGALAQLAGLELAAERPSRRITVITMASPRVLAADWVSDWRFAWGRWARKGRLADANDASLAPSTSSTPTILQHGDEHQRDTLAELLALPGNYRHFRGFLQADVVPHLPPEFLGFTHSGQRIPLNTGCTTSLSFLAWGMYSKLYHNADLYRRVLKQPIVSQTHWYVSESEEADAEEERFVGAQY